MADSTIAPPLVDASTVSIARLHGEACWHCGDVSSRLAPAGQRRTPTGDGFRLWPVVACPGHQQLVSRVSRCRS